MLKLGFLTITGCSFWNIFFPPRGGLGPKGCVGRTLMITIFDPKRLFSRRTKGRDSSLHLISYFYSVVNRFLRADEPF